MTAYFAVRDLLSRPAVGSGARALLAPLAAAGWLYAVGASLRRAAYRRGILRSHRAGVPVISVGNVTAGGTGKTPCVQAVCRLLQEAGLRPAILSRGYGGRLPGPWAVVSDGESVLLSSEAAGDEPELLARSLPGVPVLVGADRRTTAREARSRFDAEVLVLDDGFQHRRLARDLDLVAVDATNPWGNGRCLPGGLLREPLSALGEADAVLLTRAGRAPPHRLDAIERALRRKGLRAPVVRATHAPAGVVDLGSGDRLPVEELAGLKVLAFAGIANPAAFFSDLQGLGARVVEGVPYPDHHRFSRADVEKLLEWARLTNAEAVVTTEKDAVRLAAYLPLPVRLLALRIEFRLLSGEPVFRRLVLEAVGRTP